MLLWSECFLLMILTIKHKNSSRLINDSIYFNLQLKWKITRSTYSRPDQPAYFQVSIFFSNPKRSPATMKDTMRPWIMAIRVAEFSNGGDRIRKIFCLRINILKGNYWILRIGLMGRCQKVPKLDFQSQFSMSKIIAIFIVFSLTNTIFLFLTIFLII